MSRYHAGTKGAKRKNGRFRSVGQHSGILVGNLGDSRWISKPDLRPDSTVAQVTRFKLPSPLSSAARKRPVAQRPGPFSILPSHKKPAAREHATRHRQDALPNQLLNRTCLPAAAIPAAPATPAVVEREAHRPRRANVSRTAIVPRPRVAPSPHRRAIPRRVIPRAAIRPGTAVRVRIAASTRAAPSTGLGRGRTDRAHRQRGDGPQYHHSHTLVHVSNLLQTTESSPTWPFTALWMATPQTIPAMRGQMFRHKPERLVSGAWAAPTRARRAVFIQQSLRTAETGQDEVGGIKGTVLRVRVAVRVQTGLRIPNCSARCSREQKRPASGAAGVPINNNLNLEVSHKNHPKISDCN